MNAATDNGNTDACCHDYVEVGKLAEYLRPLPPSPTRAQPGSDEKIAVMRWRFLNGYHLHHPGDVRICDDPYQRISSYLILKMEEAYQRAKMEGRVVRRPPAEDHRRRGGHYRKENDE